MSKEHISTYLNDHLSGSVVAIEMLQHLEETYAGSDIGSFASKLRGDIEQDRQELKSLMNRLEISESTPRKASGWVAGKFTEIKLRIDDKAGGDLHLYEYLEALSLGIEGKRSLWQALESAGEVNAMLRLADYKLLINRAEEQRGGVEERRLKAAKVAFG
jgi:hypothetical protein